MAFIPYGVWRQLAIPIMVMTIVVLAAVLALGTGAVRRDTASAFGSSIQPSEFAKLAVTIYVAAWVAARGDKISGFQDGLVPFMIIMFGVTGLIILQHSFSVTIIVLCYRPVDLLRRRRQPEADRDSCWPSASRLSSWPWRCPTTH